MGNIRDFLVADHPNYIESDRFVEQIIAAQIEECRAVDLPLFSAINSLRRVTESGVFPGFDLNENICIIVFADNINFTGFLPIISGFDAKTFGPKMLDGDIFASFTETYPFLRQTLSLP